MENAGVAFFKEHFFFLNKKSNVFEIKMERFVPNKITLLSGWIWILEKWQAVNKLIWKKIENFVRSKCYTEYVSKDKGKIANLRKSLKNFKMGIILHTKGKEGWYLEMIENF